MKFDCTFPLNFNISAQFLQISFYLKSVFKFLSCLQWLPFLGCYKEPTTTDRIFNNSATSVPRRQELTSLLLTENLFFLTPDVSRQQQESLRNLEIRSKFPPSVGGRRVLMRAAHSQVKSCGVKDNLTDDALLTPSLWRDGTPDIQIQRLNILKQT